MVSTPVTVTLDGSIVATSDDATLVAGTVMAPATPFLDVLAVRHAPGPGDTIVIEGGGRRISVPFVVSSGVARIPLATVARALGYAVVFSKSPDVLALERPDAQPIGAASPQTLGPGPFVTAEPRAASSPARPAPTAVARPRRTPVAVTEPTPALPLVP